MSRNKGQRGEREVIGIIDAAVNEVYGYLGVEPPNLERNLCQAQNGGFDIAGLPGFGVEVKFVETGFQQAWWNQAVEQARADGLQPVLWYRRKHKPWRIMTEMAFRPAGMTQTGFVPATVDQETWLTYLRWYLFAYLSAEGFQPPAAIPENTAAIVGGLPEASFQGSEGSECPEACQVAHTDVECVNEPCGETPFPEVPDTVPSPYIETPEPPEAAPVENASPPPAAPLVILEESRARMGEAAPAQDFFTSKLFRKAKVYAERAGYPVGIVTAPAVLSLPTDMVAPYDGTLAKLSAAEFRDWVDDFDTRLVDSGNLILLGTGKRFTKLGDDSKTWRPLEGMKRAEALTMLDSMIEALPEENA